MVEEKIQLTARQWDDLVNKVKSKAPSIEYIKQEIDTTAGDIDEWKYARELALQIDDPLRYLLMNEYEKAMLNTHLTSVIETRKSRTLGEAFELVDASGEVLEDETIEVNKYIREFFNLVLDSVYWGAQVIKINDIPDNNILSFKVLRRRNLEPFSKRMLEDETQYSKGNHYDKAGLQGWLIRQDHTPEFLGLLEIIVPLATISKMVMADWGKASARAGVPIRVSKTDTSNKEAVAQLAKGMEDFAVNSSMILGLMDEFEVIAATAGDLYLTYKELITMLNGEISKAILGVTMLSDDGSSKSQSEVHERVSQFRSKADMYECERIANTQLIPKLQAIGILPASVVAGRFKQKDARPMDEIASIDFELMDRGYTFEVDYINEKYKTQASGFVAPNQPAEEEPAEPSK